MDAKKKAPDGAFDNPLPDGFAKKLGADSLLQVYESIRFDLQRNIDVKNEDFDKLFPKLTLSLETGSGILESLNCMSIQMLDMANYCKRLL